MGEGTKEKKKDSELTQEEMRERVIQLAFGHLALFLLLLRALSHARPTPVSYFARVVLSN